MVHTMQGTRNGIGFEYIPSILSWLASGGVLEVEQISTFDGTNFSKDLKPL